MQDIIKKYKKYKLFSNINIILVSLVMAFGVNVLIIDGTNLGGNLKSNILESGGTEQKSNISIESINDDLYITANKTISNISSLGLSIAFNSNNIILSDITSDLGNIANLSNTEGMNSIILTIDKPIDILEGTKIIKIGVTKKNNTNTETLNLINANFKDGDNERYSLSTSGITF